jgi:predicted amidophosphoribosyltransferase
VSNEEIRTLQLELSKDPAGTICSDCGSAVAHRLEKDECKRCLYKGGNEWAFSRAVDVDKAAAVLMLLHGVERTQALTIASDIFNLASYEGGQDCS